MSPVRIVWLVFLLLHAPTSLAQSDLKLERVADINPGAGNGNPGGLAGREFVVFEDILYLLADDGFSGAELFRYDGNTIQIVADINRSVISGN